MYEKEKPRTYRDQRYEDGKETRNMEDENEGFELWQYLASVRVEEDSNSHDTPIHHCPLPKCWTITGMVELGQG